MCVSMPNTLDSWFSHIEHLHYQRMDFGLERIGIVAQKLSLTHFSCPVITVAGTNGKGSCAKTLESIYVAAGFKVGLYTSPHLLEFNERIRIQNHPVSDTNLMRAFSVIEEARQNVTLSFFEFITLAALYLFREAKLDVVILEVGLGGRLDAVNIVESDIAVVTSIALDHQEYLGDDRESIAFEKTSIARAGKYLVCGEENPPHTIAKTVLEKQAKLFQIDRDFFYQDNTYSFYDPRSHFSDPTQHVYRLTILKPHLKPQNIATALAVIYLLRNSLMITEKDVQEGVKNTIWPGRFEFFSFPFSGVLDVAHNPHATVWLAKQYAALPRVNKTIAVVGMLKDKDMIETLRPLLSLVDLWCVCSLSSLTGRGSDGVTMVDFLHSQKIKSCYTFDSVSSAMDFVSTEKGDRVLIFGSFYTVAEAKKWLEENALLTVYKKLQHYR